MANEMNNLVVRLSLDNVNFRQGIANSGRAVRTLQNELKSISTGMGGFANASEQTRAKTDALNRLIEAQKEKVRAIFFIRRFRQAHHRIRRHRFFMTQA
ncbi:hypothetical protein ACT4US_31865, partial [Bacillus sp. HC-Mk]